MDMTTVGEAVETGQSQEWFDAHRTTPEEQETATWAEGRTRDIEASKALRDTLGLEYGPYSKQLDALSSEERLDLKDKTAEEIAEVLDARAEAGRELQKLEKQAKAQAEDNFDGAETPHLREVRKAMKSAYKEVSSLDERIGQLQRLNEIRYDPSSEEWDNHSSEEWRTAREGNMESLSGEIANLIQEKQAKLQEAALHQNAYHEEARTTQPQFVDRPLGQIVGNDGRPMEITRADITSLVQLERDEQAHQQRIQEASNRYPDWEQQRRNAVAAGADVGPREVAFIKSLPNSADVVYYLCSHPNETIALRRMSSHEVTRELINISHKTARPGTHEVKKTGAPRPPSPVSGSSRGDFDVNDESESADTWLQRRNADLRRRGRAG